MTDNDVNERIKNYFARHREVLETAEKDNADSIATCVERLFKAISGGNKVLIMGNGGSAADAQHFAAELVGRFLLERQGYPAIALTTDSSILTAIGNDYGFDRIFERQVEALAVPGDVVIGISTSGNSENVYRALKLAREKKCGTIGLLGKDGGRIAEEAKLSLIIRSAETPHIQEMHGMIIHLLCDLLEQKLVGG